MMDIRRLRFAKQLKEEIANLILMELKDPRLEGVIITGIDLSQDMSVAKIYFTTLQEGKEEETKRALEHAESFIRKRLLKSLKVKRLPRLLFLFDKDLKNIEKIWEKL